jgi:hypothetical protein
MTMNKDKAKRIVEIAQIMLTLQKELKEIGVTVGFSQSLSDAVSYSQGYLKASDDLVQLEEVK